MNQNNLGSGIHPAPAQFSAEQLSTDPILHFFHYTHLPAALQFASLPFCNLAQHIVMTLPRNAERTVALRKLLEAKDAAVRANVGAVASGGSFLDRLKTEQSELHGRLVKLREFLANPMQGVSSVQRDMLNEQATAMADYHAILVARIENIEHAAGLGQVRETGGHDQDRDGDPPFGG